MTYHTEVMREAKKVTNATLAGSTVFDRYPAQLAAGEPLKIAVTSSRHGIGGAATDLTHIKAILEAAQQKFPNRKVEMHVFGGNQLALDGLLGEGSPYIFHKDAYYPAKPGANSLDPLQPLKGQNFLSSCAKINPHYVVALDSAAERHDWTVDQLLGNSNIAAVISSDTSLAQSGFYAADTLKISAPHAAPIVINTPSVVGHEGARGKSVYGESALIAMLFGGEAKPYQAVAQKDLSWAKRVYQAYGYSPRKHERLVYIHEGTSTSEKELTPEQISLVMKQTFKELTTLGVDPTKVFFAVSPQPINRPEVSKAYIDVITSLGGQAVLLPEKTTLGQAKALIALADASLTADTYAYHAAIGLGGAANAHFTNRQIVGLRVWGHNATVGADMNPAATEAILVKEDLSPENIAAIAELNALVIAEGSLATHAEKMWRQFVWEGIQR